MSAAATIYRLWCYRDVDSVCPGASIPVADEADIPHGAWLAEGYAREQVEVVSVRRDGGEHTQALANSAAMRAERGA